MYKNALSQMSRTFKGVYFCLKKLSCIQHILLVLFCGVICALSVFHGSFVSYADVNDLLIASGSNALMTLDLGDDDYGIMPLSSLGSVANTVDLNGIICTVTYWDSSSKTSKNKIADVSVVDNRLKVFADVGTGNNIYRLNFNLYSDNLPHSGNYLFSFDYASDFSHDYSNVSASLYSEKLNSNAATEYGDISAFVTTNSGDLYISPMDITLTNVSRFVVITYMDDSKASSISGYASFNFTKSTGSGPSTAGSNTSDFDYQSDVSSSLSDLSSSVGDMTEEISGVTEAIQNLQGAMEPHYSNVLTQLHHITEQLHAFWDQLYNMFFLPQYALLGEIRDAITGMETGLGGVISDVSSAIQAKLQSVQDAVTAKIQASTDEITQGFDDSKMQEQNSEFADAVAGINDLESGLINEVMSLVNAGDEFTQPIFEFDSLPFGVLTSLSFLGQFMNVLFLAMDDFAFIPLCSLLFSFLLVVFGFYRIRN